MTSPVLEIRQAARSLMRNAGYSVSVVLTLTLGIAAAAAVFALIDGVLLRPLPYPGADRLLLIRQQNLETDWNTSVVDFRAIEDQSTSFDAVASMRSMDVVLTGGREPQWVSARWVTSAFFDVMGIMPARGRAFHPGEDAPGAAPAAVVGHAFAERYFGAGRDPLGRALTLDGVAHTVVGVMPPGVEQLPGMRAEVWPAMRLEEPGRRGPFLLSTLARLKPGVTIEQSAAELAAISERIFPLWQDGFQDATARLTPRALQTALVGGSGPFLWIAFGAVLFVLLIALVNTTNLVLMRATERLRDLSVRAALGAGRARLARLLITENLLLTGMGGLAGIGLASLLLDLYRALGPELPRLAEVAIDGRVAAFVGGAALLSGLLLGTMPVLFAGAGKDTLLHQGRGTARKEQHLLRNGLVVLEFALTLPLLIGAGLLISSLLHLNRVEPGFEPDRLLTARVRLPETTYPDELTRLAFWERALIEFRGLPGVLAAGLATGVPPDAPAFVNNFDIAGRPSAQGSQPMSPWTSVTPGFFEALGVRLLEGRGFNAGDTPESPPFVVLVTEAWAKRYFPGESAVGKQLYEGGDRTAPVTIAGVTSDVKFAGLERPGDSVFAPMSQGWYNNPAYVYLRTEPEPLALAEPLRAALARLDPALVPAEVTAMESRLRDSLGDERHWATVVLGFALLAVLLSAAGVSGVLAYYVSRQQREIGIRMALGADAGSVLGMVIRRGMGCALAGGVIGIVLAFFLTRSLGSLLLQVQPTDPVTLVLACALLLAIALVASWLPARRAARVDPMVALRLDQGG